MASQENDNPSAFPRADLLTSDGCGIREGADGMTLRDYFAAHAPVTLFDAAMTCGWDSLEAATMPKDEYRVTLWSVMTLMRYEYADAMLAARVSA